MIIAGRAGFRAHCSECRMYGAQFSFNEYGTKPTCQCCPLIRSWVYQRWTDMDGWMDGPGDCLASQKAHNVVIALTKRKKKKKIPFSFLSFPRLSRIACVGVLSVLRRACCHISEMGISGSFRLSLACSAEQRGEELSISEVFKPPNQRWKWNCQGRGSERDSEGGRKSGRGGGSGALAVYRKWRVQMNGVRFGTRG